MSRCLETNVSRVFMRSCAYASERPIRFPPDSLDRRGELDFHLAPLPHVHTRVLRHNRYGTDRNNTNTHALLHTQGVAPHTYTYAQSPAHLLSLFSLVSSRLHTRAALLAQRPRDLSYATVARCNWSHRSCNSRTSFTNPSSICTMCSANC